jgi:hypothetical protein
MRILFLDTDVFLDEPSHHPRKMRYRYRRVAAAVCVLKKMCSCDVQVPTMYVPSDMEKHELDFVMSACTMSCHVRLHDCTGTRHRKD